MKEVNEVKLILDNFYNLQTTIKNKKNNFFICESIYNTENGLGDSIILTSVFPNIKVNSNLLSTIDSKYINKELLTNEIGTSVTKLSENDWNGGHCIQRIQKSLGLNVEKKPKVFINYDIKKRISNKVFVHLKNNTDWKRNIPNSLDEVQIDKVVNFFNFHNEFLPFYFNNDLEINELISVMETCEFFLGIDSGPMHLAAAMDIKSVVIINDPKMLICLPKIKECELPNAEWLYPQNVHLNKNGETELIPKFSEENILNAINGAIYPYWSEEYLNLIK
jgi:hypothetical protein